MGTMFRVGGDVASWLSLGGLSVLVVTTVVLVGALVRRDRHAVRRRDATV
jgi:hypothetical protein